METSQDILVIILSTAFAILLVLIIVIAGLIIALLRSIKRITGKAERVLDSAEHVGEVFSNATGSLALFKLLRNVMELVAKHTPSKK